MVPVRAVVAALLLAAMAHAAESDDGPPADAGGAAGAADAADATEAPAAPAAPAAEAAQAVAPVGVEPGAEPAPDPAVALLSDPASVELMAPTQLFDKKGRIDRTAYVTAAIDVSLVGLNRRLGPDAAAFIQIERAGAKKRKSAVTAPADDPLIWMPPTQFFKGARNGHGMAWEVGGPATADPGDYSSTHAQVMYRADKPNADPGVDRIAVLEMGHHLFTYKPQPTWWGGSHPEPAVGTQAWRTACGGGIGTPVAMARAYGNWSNSCLMVFSSGLIGTAGTCTSQNSAPFLVLPRGKVPTAISITNKNEFALITVWDLATCRGQLAVVALESMHTDGLMALYEWHQRNPCLPNVGGFTSLKLMGFIDLPVAAPTAICAVGNRRSEWLHLDGKNSQAKDFDFATQAVRDSFGTGENAAILESAGFAVVLARHEDKAVFIDLQPLFDEVRDAYCTSAARFAQTRGYGPGPGQWPSFELTPKARPVVVRTVAVKNPSAVTLSLSGGPAARACIATVDGRLLIYDVGGLATEEPADPAGITAVGMVRIGRNPVCLAYSKSQGWDQPGSITTDLVAVCRGDRELDFVHLDGDRGTVTHRLRDARLVDPVYAEFADSHGTESHVFSVVDFKGRKVVNYRNGPVIFHTNGGARFPMGADGTAEFECGGVMQFPGYPFALCGTNVN